MIGTALVTLALLFAAQGLLVVKVADLLTDGAAARRADARPAGGRYAVLA